MTIIAAGAGICPACGRDHDVLGHCATRYTRRAFLWLGALAVGGAAASRAGLALNPWPYHVDATAGIPARLRLYDRHGYVVREARVVNGGTKRVTFGALSADVARITIVVPLAPILAAAGFPSGSVSPDDMKEILLLPSRQRRTMASTMGLRLPLVGNGGDLAVERQDRRWFLLT